jgi:hypothetical protein
MNHSSVFLFLCGASTGYRRPTKNRFMLAVESLAKYVFVSQVWWPHQSAFAGMLIVGGRELPEQPTPGPAISEPAAYSLHGEWRHGHLAHAFDGGAATL